MVLYFLALHLNILFYLFYYFFILYLFLSLPLCLFLFFKEITTNKNPPDQRSQATQTHNTTPPSLLPLFNPQPLNAQSKINHYHNTATTATNRSKPINPLIRNQLQNLETQTTIAPPLQHHHHRHQQIETYKPTARKPTKPSNPNHHNTTTIATNKSEPINPLIRNPQNPTTQTTIATKRSKPINPLIGNP